MAIKVVLAEAHNVQYQNAAIQEEIKSIENGVNHIELPLTDNTVNFVFIKGNYVHSERRMFTICLFVNKMKETLTEIHGVIRMKFQQKSALIAKTTVDFDKQFIGKLNPNEALLVQIGISVKGLGQDEEFVKSNISGNFSEVRVTTNNQIKKTIG